MNLTDFGLLVKALRHNRVDNNGNRWTRESLSENIHLTPNQLGRLERGDRKYLDTQTLQLLAKSLNLTNLEQKEFLFAAVGLTEEELHSQVEPETQFNDLIGVMENLRVPSFIIDNYSDIVAASESILNLYQITPAIIDSVGKIPAGFNHVYYTYFSGLRFKEIIGASHWRKSADRAVLLFRRTTLRFRHTDYFNYLLKALLKDKQFDVDWYSSHRFLDNRDITYAYFEYEHPCYGPLSYIATETLLNTARGDLYLIIYNPANAVTSTIFTELLNKYENKTRRLAPWPEKKMI